MKRHFITAAAVLGLGAVTIAVAQPGPDRSQPPSSRTIPPGDQACDGGQADRASLHARVAKLRAEVELLQLQHDAIKATLSDRLQGVEKANAEITGDLDQTQVAASYMRMGAESVGKAAEFDQKAQADRAELQKELENATAKASENRTSLNTKKEEFVRLTTDLNRKKIELVELEVKLDGSM